MGEVNMKLKELMETDEDQWTPDFQREFFEELKESRLLLPVEFGSELPDFEELNEGDSLEISQNLRFKTIKLQGDDGRIAIPLFTDGDELMRFGRINAMEVAAEDLADTLVQDKSIDDIIINPSSERSMGFPLEAFVDIFRSDRMGMVDNIAKILREHAVPLEENMMFFLRTPTPYMFDEAEDGIYTSEIPFNASLEDLFHPEYPYLNLLLVPAGTFILGIRSIIDDPSKNHDVIIAPTVRFKLEEREDDNIFIWRCMEQDFER